MFKPKITLEQLNTEDLYSLDLNQNDIVDIMIDATASLVPNISSILQKCRQSEVTMSYREIDLLITLTWKEIEELGIFREYLIELNVLEKLSEFIIMEIREENTNLRGKAS